MEERKVTVIIGNGFPMRSAKILPNALCSCGSGKKAKKCCGAKTEYYYSKLNEKQKQEKEEREKKQIF